MKKRYSGEKHIIDRARSIVNRRLSDKNICLSSLAKAKDLASLKLSLYEVEVFAAFLLDSQLNVIKYVELFKGTIDYCSVFPREIVKLCLIENAGSIILMHNHPSGKVSPSSADINVTKRISRALELIDTRVQDHLIFAGENCYSFAQHGLINGANQSSISVV